MKFKSSHQHCILSINNLFTLRVLQHQSAPPLSHSYNHRPLITALFSFPSLRTHLWDHYSAFPVSTTIRPLSRHCYRIVSVLAPSHQSLISPALPQSIDLFRHLLTPAVTDIFTFPSVSRHCTTQLPTQSNYLPVQLSTISSLLSPSPSLLIT